MKEESTHQNYIQSLLSDKDAIVALINRKMKIENTSKKIKKEQLKKYNKNIVITNFKDEERTNVIYKIKDKNVFFLIKYQTEIDYVMPFRILEANLAIIRNEISKGKETKNENQIPTIYSFVLYSGKKKWDAKLCIKENMEVIENYNITSLSHYEVIALLFN